jgi:EAL domain-containing protein (putative c-di-GMP-specific phosphodiesterase class I)
MQYLHDLPISFIKIDQSFVRRLPFDKSAISICEATVQMAQKMGLQTIAEGVEDRQAYDCLAEMGCDFAQGFMIAKPQPAEQYKTWHMQNADCRLRLPPHATR